MPGKKESGGSDTRSVVGLSRGDLSRATLGMTVQHPVTLYTTAGGVLGVLAAALLGPTVPFFGLAVGGLSLGAGSWIVNYFFRNENFARKYLLSLILLCKKLRMRLRRRLIVLQNMLKRVFLKV